MQRQDKRNQDGMGWDGDKAGPDSPQRDECQVPVVTRDTDSRDLSIYPRAGHQVGSHCILGDGVTCHHC